MYISTFCLYNNVSTDVLRVRHTQDGLDDKNPATGRTNEISVTFLDRRSVQTIPRGTNCRIVLMFKIASGVGAKVYLRAVYVNREI